jgi:hypothetical protein
VAGSACGLVESRWRVCRHRQTAGRGGERADAHRLDKVALHEAERERRLADASGCVGVGWAGCESRGRAGGEAKMKLAFAANVGGAGEGEKTNLQA